MATKALKTSTFVWEGTDKRGGKVKGELSGPNQALVKAQLRKQGINPTKVRKQAFSFGGQKKKKITPFDIAILNSDMAEMDGKTTG